MIPPSIFNGRIIGPIIEVSWTDLPCKCPSGQSAARNPQQGEFGRMIRPPSKSTFSIKSLMFAGILVGNCLLNVAKVFKMIWSQFLWQGSGVKGHRKVTFSNSEFFISDCRFGFVAKKYECKVSSFFWYSDQNTVKFKFKVTKSG